MNPPHSENANHNVVIQAPSPYNCVLDVDNSHSQNSHVVVDVVVVEKKLVRKEKPTNMQKGVTIGENEPNMKPQTTNTTQENQNRHPIMTKPFTPTQGIQNQKVQHQGVIHTQGQ